MDDFAEMRILRRFHPYVPFIKAYKSDNFRQSDWHPLLCSVFRAFYATMMFISTPIMAALIVWYLLDEEQDPYEIVVGVPNVLSLLLADSLFVAMMWKNDEIVQTVECLNGIVEQREYEYLGILAVVFFAQKREFCV